MSISQRIDQRQSQTLVMTPQLQQAIKLLQMSNLELGDFVEQEIEKNPLLEHADQNNGDGAVGDVAGSATENFSQAEIRPDAEPAAPGDDSDAPQELGADDEGSEDRYARTSSGSGS